MLAGLLGQTVTKVSFDSSVYLLFGDAGQVQIETVLTLTNAHGRRQWSEGLPVEVTGQLVQLMWATVQEVEVDESTGSLLIAFDEGRSLEVRSDEDYEAWNFAGPHGHKIVCSEGGGLVTWDPVDQARPL